MRKQQTSGLDFIKYLALQNKHFKLTPTGEILGMDRYKQNARNTQQQFSLPGEDYTQELSISNHTLDANANIQSQTDANANIEVKFFSNNWWGQRSSIYSIADHLQESEKVLKNFVDRSLKKILVNILVTS